MTWEIFSQEDIKLDSKEVKQVRLGFGFKMNEGVVLKFYQNPVHFFSVIPRGVPLPHSNAITILRQAREM